jgi:2,4'-dihydroxyacetophenone dioxygenase
VSQPSMRNPSESKKNPLEQLHEYAIQADDENGWEPQQIPGLEVKMLWEEYQDGPSVALLRFAQGAGISRAHVHASNQFMYCLSGRYAYTASGIILTPGMFYWNPKDHPHGPTEALEPSVLIEIYDGPHYYEQPDFHGGTGVV